MRRCTALESACSALLLLTLVALLPLPVLADSKEDAARGWLGIQLGTPVRGASADNPAADATPGGIQVRYVVEDSPAAKAGLRARDVIELIDGNPVTTTSDLLGLIANRQPGEWLSLTITRGEQERQLRAKLAERPRDMKRLKMRRAWLGVKTLDLPPKLREHFGAPADSGVMIADIESESPALAAGFAIGDLVFELDGEPVRSAGDMRQRVAGGGVGNTIEFKLMRSGVEIELEMMLESDPNSRGRR